MSTRFIVAAAAAAVYTYASGGDVQGGATVFTLVYGATGFLDPNIKVTGPRLEDLKNTKAAYGEPITWVAGHPRVAGNIIWSSEKREIANTEEQEKGGPGTDVTTFTYEQDLLIVLCENTGYRPRRIWSNGKLIWSAADTADGETVLASQQTDAWRELRMYTGEPSQMPDPTYEAALGVGNAPANRGRSSVMLVGVNLGGSGYPPSLTFEISDADVGEVAGFIERFDDGLDNYSTADPAIFEIVATPDGDGLHIIGGLITAISSNIYRDFPSEVEFTSCSWNFKLDAPLSDPVDDAGAIDIRDGATSVLLFTPSREESVDGLRRAMLATPGGAQTYVSNTALENDVWYTLRIEPVSELAILCTILEKDAGTLVKETAISLASSTFTANRIVFFDQASVGGGSKPGVTYDEIVVGQDSITVPLEDAPLDQVVLEQCLRAGLAETDVDVTQLEGQFVRSIGVGQVSSARATIDALASVFFFEAVDDGDKIVFVPRGGEPVAALTLEDLGASQSVDVVEPLPITRGNEIEAPAQVVVNYANVSNDHQDGSERSDRLSTASSIVNVVQAPVGLTPNEAARVAAKAIQDIASGIMRVGPIALSREHADLLPTDVVTVTDQFSRAHRIRLLKRTDSGGVLTFEAVFDDASAMVSDAETSNNYANSEQVRRPGPSELQIFDAPIMRDADNYLGQLAAIKWTRGVGSTLFESVDGTAFTAEGSVTREAVLGESVDALGDWTGGNVFDMVNSVEVDVGDGELASWTRADVFNGTAPGYMLGAEVFYALDADMQSAGVYILSGLLRGQRGTEWAMGDHAAGEPFVLLANNGLLKISHEPADLNVEHQFKAVTSGLQVSAASTQAATDTGVALKPFNPVNMRSSRDAGGLSVTFDRRTRLAENWLAGTVPLGEDSESYEVDIEVSGDVVRTLTSSTPSVLYSPAQQAEDGVTSATALTITAYQMSATVGRGYGESIVTTGGYSSVAGETEVTVGGSFGVGRILSVLANGILAQHVTVSGDTNLSGAATSLAAAVDALAGVSASAAGPVITIEADSGGPLVVTASVIEPSMVTQPYTLQIASGVSAGSPEIWDVGLAIVGASSLPPGRFRIRLQRSGLGISSVDINADYLTSTTLGTSSILAGLCDAINSGVPNSTYGITATNYGTSARVQFAVGEAGWSATGSTVSIDGPVSHVWGGGRIQEASPVVVAPQPQITYVGVAGTTTTGDTYHVTVNATTYDYTALGGDDGADVAAALATLIDANAAVIAVDVSGTTPAGLSTYPGLIRITGASNAVPFTISTSTDATMTLTVAVITEGV